jgi:small subunit ribosomal protein S15
MVKTAQVVEKPVWLKLSEEDLKKILVELKDKYPPAHLGLILRDQYGIPTTRIFGKKLSAYLKEAGIDTLEVELKNVQKKEEKLKEHIKKHKQDKKAKHKVQITVSKVSKIKKYLSRKNKTQ